MSTLTKVFAVLLVVFSIAFSIMVVSVASQQTHWKDQHDRKDRALLIAETNLRNTTAANLAALAIAEDKVNEQLKQMGALQTEYEKSRNELAALKADRSQADAERSNTEAINRGLVGQLQVAQSTSDEYRKQRDDLEKRDLELGQRNIDLNGRVNELTSRVVVLVEQGRQAEQQLNILKKENEALATSTARAGSAGRLEAASGLAIPGVSAETPIPRSAVRGKVLEVAGNLVTISVGSSDGVEKGMVFVIHRDRKYIGDVKINLVEPNQSVGRLIQSATSTQPAAEDQVTDEQSLTAGRG